MQVPHFIVWILFACDEKLESCVAGRCETFSFASQSEWTDIYKESETLGGRTVHVRNGQFVTTLSW